MLIALFTILILGGGGGLIGDIKGVRKEVKAVMEKSDERDAALSTLKQMEKLTSQRDKNYKKYLKQFLVTVSDHEYKISYLDQLWDEYRGTRSNFNVKFIELRFELKEHISREDWARVFSPD
jgi:uncharacterized protein YozE (UPF0346 family)